MTCVKDIGTNVGKIAFTSVVLFLALSACSGGQPASTRAPALPESTGVVEPTASPLSIPTPTIDVPATHQPVSALTPTPTTVPTPVPTATSQPAPVSTLAPLPTQVIASKSTQTPLEIATPTVPAPTTPPTAPATTSIPATKVAQARALIVEFQPGSVARYRVREQFARRNLPNDAVGETSEVSGSLVFDAGGMVQQDRSIITVGLRSLGSDDDDRDDFLQDESLESIKFPLATLVVDSTPGLPWPLPQDSEFEFQLKGDMTVHGVTKATTWDVTAQVTAEGLIGQARTSFKFEKFEMKKPSVFFILSVEDNIRLELDFIGTMEAIPDE